MLDVSIQITGVDTVRSRLAALPMRLEKNILRGAVRAAAVVVRNAIRGETPTRSKRLWRSVRVRSVRVEPGLVRGRVTVGDARAWYAHIVEDGARPHRIERKLRKSLKLGQRFVKSVDHPGMRGRGFVRAGREAARAPAQNAFNRYVDGRIERFWRSGR